jgi:hypothetical protein
MIEDPRSEQEIEDEALADALDRAQDDRMAEVIGPILWKHGHGRVPEPEATRANRERVEAMLERDKADRIRERDRRLAELEVSHDNFINLSDTVIEPTPEWLEKGEVRPYTPKQPDGTARVVRTVRRLSLPRVLMMHQAGNLSDDHLAACIWYRSQFEEAGLQGRVKSSLLSLAGNVGGGGGGDGQFPMPLHEREAIARQLYRGARANLTAFYVRFFEAVALRDVPISRAARFARCRAERAPLRFRDCCNQVIEYMDKNEIEPKKYGDEG